MVDGGSFRSGKYGFTRTLIINTPNTQVMMKPVRNTPCLSRGQRFLYGSKKTGTSRILGILRSLPLRVAVEFTPSSLGAKSEDQHSLLGCFTSSAVFFPKSRD